MVINTKDSHKKHRCYSYLDTCVCECIDDVDFEYVGGNPYPTTTTTDSRYQEGTVQGNTAGIPQDAASALNAFGALFGAYTDDGHKGTMADQAVFAEHESDYKTGRTHDGRHGGHGLVRSDRPLHAI